MQRRHWIILGGGALLLAGAMLWSFRPQPVPVEVAAVRRGAFELTVDEDGKTRVRERYVVSAPLAGRLARITLQPGDAVTAGKPVARLQPLAPALLDARTRRELQERVGSAQAQLAQAAAERARAEAALLQAQTDLARQRKLEGEGFLAPATRDQAELAQRVLARAVEAAAAGEEAGRHLLAQARAALLRAQGAESGADSGAALPVTAPVTGQVLRVLQQSEAVVALGTPLLEVADTRDLEIVVDVLSTDAVRIASGAAVRVQAGAQAFGGRVRRIEPAAFTKVSALGVEEQRVNVIVDLDAGAAPAALGDGFRVDLKLVVFHSADALMVPVAALFRRGNDGEREQDWAVFALEGDRAVERAVKVAARGPLDAMLAGGLDAGAQVVVYPGDALRSGARVEVLRGRR